MDTAQLVALSNEWAWLAKIVGLVAFTLLMVMVVGLLYSGDVQSAEKGPISLRAKPNMADSAFHSVDPIVSNALDQKRATCRFFVVYVDRRGRPRKQSLFRGDFQLSKLTRSPTRDRGDFVGYWNPKFHEEIFSSIEASQRLQDPPGLFSAGTDEELKARIEEYFKREAAETRLVSLSQGVVAKIADAHQQHFRQQFDAFAKIPDRKLPWTKDKAKASQDLPNLSEDAHYYVEMKFPIWPWYVLMSHPDGQVKTTAWLTVLTSLFAVVMQILYNGLS